MIARRMRGARVGLRLAAAGVLAGALTWAAPVEAQTVAALRPRRVVISAGLGLTGPVAIGDLTASLRRNTTGTPPPFTLLRAESEIEPAAGADVRVALPFNSNLAIEVAGGYASPRLGVRVSQDPEVTEGAFISERLSQYTVDVTALYLLPGRLLGRRARIYALGGGGYLRQLHEGRLQVETGRTIHAGGGVMYWLRGGRAVSRRSFGLRGDARYIYRDGGIEFEGRGRGYPAVSVLAFGQF